MKASIKFREDQKPLFKAKVPLNILGLPFQSGIVAGESKELSLNLSTFFESGPSIRISYRPNDTFHPFSLTVKTGTGPFGSPLSSSMLMSADFNLLGKNNPSFMLHFKPQFGDFSVKKSQSSSVFEKSPPKFNAGVLSDDDGSIEVVESPVMNGEVKRVTAVLPPHTAAAMASVFSGLEVAARTKVPVRERAVVSFRWGVRVPAEINCSRGGGEAIGGINWRKLPFLVMNKVGIEHVEGTDFSRKGGSKEKNGSGNGDVEEVCFAVKRQLEVLQAENGMLRKAVDELREEFASGRVRAEFGSGRFREERSGNGKNGEKRSGEKRVVDGSVHEELKKALKGANGGGAGA